jgi:alginate O-acetyltransferase complex protein AlgI
MWVTMVVSGLWHGAAYTFIIWGAIHAFFLGFERINKNILKRIPTIFLYLFTMFQVLIAWLFFRANSTNEAFDIIRKLFDFSNVNFYWVNFENAYYFLIMAVLFELFYFLSLKIKLIKQLYKNDFIQTIEIALLITACLFYRGPEQAFIYFQF